MKTKTPAFWFGILSLAFLIASCLYSPTDQTEDDYTPVKKPPHAPEATCPPPEAGAPEVNLTGIWSGTWQGKDWYYGYLSGELDFEINQSLLTVEGTGRLSGDVDCPIGEMVGAVCGSAISGTMTRGTCPSVRWAITALNLEYRTAGGTWDKPDGGTSGVWTATQIAMPDGPRITSVSPFGGLPGTIVTVAGEGFSDVPSDNLVQFNGRSVDTILSASTTSLVVDVPHGAATGRVTVETAQGTAISPRDFSTAVSSPALRISDNFGVPHDARTGIVFTPDGRRALVWSHGGLIEINTASGRSRTIGSVPFDDGYGIAISPDGQWLYAPSKAGGIRVLDAATYEQWAHVPVHDLGGVPTSAQGVAVSPDGRRFYVADANRGGNLYVIDLDVMTVARSRSFTVDTKISGIAPSPDGQTVYVTGTATETNQGTLYVLEADLSALIAAYPFGYSVAYDDDSRLPVSLAVTPDGKRVYFTSRFYLTPLWMLAVAAQTVVEVPLNAVVGQYDGAWGLAVSPDGKYLFVPGDQGVTRIVDVASNTQIDTLSGSYGTSVVFSPDGKSGYMVASSLQEIGGVRTLSVSSQGTGRGTITSSPAGISCGSLCLGRFLRDTVVQLTPIADADSYFDGWSGDVGCGHSVKLSTNLACRATFNRHGGGGGGDGGDCWIATAAYGTPMAPQIGVLREFREQHLRNHAAGRALIRLYAHYSPPIADWIRERDAARAVARGAIWPILFAIQNPGTALSVVLVLPAGAAASMVWRRF